MRKIAKSIFIFFIALTIALSISLFTSTKASAASAEEELYQEMISAIVAAIPQEFSDAEKAVYIHEFFTANFEYDTTYSIYTGYEFFLYGTGVCQAYAEAYRDVMNAMGIECHIAVSDDANHAWNVVKINNNYYHVDCTWDDPLGQEFGRSQHSYLLVSTETLHATDAAQTDYNRSDWYVPYREDIKSLCKDKTYESYGWTDSEAAFIYCNDMWYILSSSNSTLGKTSDLSKATQTVATIDDLWFLTDGSGYYWVGCFSGLFSIGDVIYGNTSDGLWSYDTITGETMAMQFFDDASTDVYGCTYLGGGYIIFDVKDEPYSDNRGIYSLFTPLLLTEDFNFSQMLVNSRKAVLYPEDDLASEPLLDVDDDGKNTVLDLIRVKKFIAELTATETAEIS